MSELRLFTTTDGTVKECHGSAFKLESEVQALFEANLKELLGVTFVASEFRTDHGGRIDTLGIDENGFPVVIEYKLDKNKTVINQGMFYMAWIKSHPTDFWKLVFDKLGQEEADKVDQSSTRLICIAQDFTREDLGAYELMPDNIDLVRYRRFDKDHLILERITSATSSPVQVTTPTPSKSSKDKPVTQAIRDAEPKTRELLDSLKQIILSQGDDVSEKVTKLYLAYKRTRNFATIEVRNSELLLFLHLNPDTVELKHNMKDMRNIGHWGTGDLQVRIKTQEDVSTSENLISQAYEGQS